MTESERDRLARQFETFLVSADSSSGVASESLNFPSCDLWNATAKNLPISAINLIPGIRAAISFYLRPTMASAVG